MYHAELSPDPEPLSEGVAEARLELYGMLSGMLDQLKQDDPSAPGIMLEHGESVYTIQRRVDGEKWTKLSERSYVYTVDRYDPSPHHIGTSTVSLDLSLETSDRESAESGQVIPQVETYSVPTILKDINSREILVDESGNVDELQLLGDIITAINYGTLSDFWDGVPPDFDISYDTTSVIAGVQANRFYKESELDKHIWGILGSYPQDVLREEVDWSLSDTGVNDGLDDEAGDGAKSEADGEKVRFLRLKISSEEVNEITDIATRLVDLTLKFCDMNERLHIKIRLTREGGPEPRNGHIRFLLSNDADIPVQVAPERRQEMIEILSRSAPTVQDEASVAPISSGDYRPWSQSQKRRDDVGKVAGGVVLDHEKLTG